MTTLVGNPDIVEAIFETYIEEESSTPRKKRKRFLTASDGLASACSRFAWYENNEPRRGTTSSFLKRRFKYGNIHEDFIVSELSEAKGWRIKGGQMNLEMWGVKGKVDLLVKPPGRGWRLLEVKTMNPEDFKLFVKEGIAAFPRYEEQAMFYLGALQKVPFAEEDKVLKGILLAENTFPLGELHACYFDLDPDLLERMEANVESLRDIIEQREPPPRPFIKESKQCGWCNRRNECWNILKENKAVSHTDLKSAPQINKLVQEFLRHRDARNVAEDALEVLEMNLRNLMEQEKVSKLLVEFAPDVAFTVSLTAIDIAPHEVKGSNYVKLEVR